MSKEEEIEIFKSPNDSNLYKYVKLENDLEVILVSNPDTDYSSCCLSIGVGSLSNPDNIDGLAHFLEHMLFLGTEKYPIEKEFVDFITRNNGSYNATTSSIKTTYYYKVLNDKLKESLDRFSSFFISPLMNEDAVDRELNAVDSEHNNNIQNDTWRLDRMVNDQYEGHPISKFSTGNSKTLKIDGIREKVVEFYNQYYSANIMKVTIYGQESLEELEKLAREYFSPIKNKNVVIPEFEPLSLKQSVWLECEAKQSEILKLLFSITDKSISFRDYKDQSATILSHVIGHEASGSLFSVLKEKGYATALYFGPISISKYINRLEFNIFLTPLGKENIDEIMGLTFQFINNVECPKYNYDEKILISKVNWENFQKSDPQTTTTTISHHLLKVDSPSDVIKYNHFWNEFSPETIEKIRSFMRPDNMIAILYVKEVKGGTSQVEKHYGINFNKRLITQDDINKWKSIPKNDKLYAPLPNPFIPTDFSIKAPQDQKICIPETVYNENGICINHSMDHRFGTPKARVYIRFDTPLFGNTFNMFCNNLLKKSLKVVLNEKILYYLSVLEYEMKLSSFVSHTQLQAYGYSDKIFLALEEVFKFFYSFDITEDHFEKIKANVEKRYLKSMYFSPYIISSSESNLFTLNMNGPTTEKLEILKTLNRENFISYIKTYFSYINFSILIVGNATKEEAQSFGKTLNSFSRVKLASSDKFMPSRINLPQGIDNVLRKQLYDDKQTNCCTSRFCLIGEGYSLKNKCVALFLNQIIYHCYFDELRTKQQFGYIVTVYHETNANSHALRFVVQSHTKTNEEINAATETFLTAFADELNQFDENPDSFKALVEAIKGAIKAKAYNNRAQASLYWNSFNSVNNFDYDSIVCDALDDLTIQDVKQVYNDYLLPTSPKRRVFILELYPASKAESTSNIDKNKNYIQDGTHYEFRSKHGSLPNSINLN